MITYLRASQRLLSLKTDALIGLAFSCVLLGCLLHPAVADPEYGRPVDIGALSGGENNSYATGINNHNQVAGYSDITENSSHAFLYDSTHGMQDLGTLFGGSYSTASAINDAGQVAGTADNASGKSEIFLYDSAQGMQDLGTITGTSSFGISVTGLNGFGQISGYFYTSIGANSGAHAFLYSGGTVHDLGFPSGYTSSQATGLNASGQTCGYLTGGSDQVAFLHSGTGTLTASDIIALPFGFSSGQAYGINTAGQVVGTMNNITTGDTHIFLYSGGMVQDLGIPPGGSYYLNGLAINNQGQIAGDGFTYTISTATFQSTGDSQVAVNDGGHTAGSTRYFSTLHYTHATLDGQDIGALPGADYSAGNAINALGQVAGEARTDGAQSHAVLYDSQGFHDLGTAASQSRPSNPGTSRAYAINASGQIAGSSTAPKTINGYSTRAILYDAVRGFQSLVD